MENTTRWAQLAKKLADYTPSKPTIDLVRHTPIILLVGVSGAGKDTIKTALLKTGNYHEIVSHTTRPPRINDGVPEREGVEYHFIDLGTAEQMIDDGAYVEANMYSGHVYGTSVAEIQKAHDAGKAAITDLEVQGVAEYKAISSEVKAIFLLPPSYAVWQERLSRRYKGEVDEADLAKRLRTAQVELECALQADYFDLVINNNIAETVETVDAIAHDRTPGQRTPEAIALIQDMLTTMHTQY